MKYPFKQLFFAAALLIASAVPALAADVGVSVSIGQPGFYGRIDIGGYPPPQVVYPQPVIVERVAVRRAPIYLNVPPGHARHWGRHCRNYNACGQPVYFVQNSWYQREYVPYHRQRQSYRRVEYRRQYRHDHGHHYRRDERHRYSHELRDELRGRHYGYDGGGNNGYRGGNR